MGDKSLQRLNFCLSKVEQLTTMADNIQVEAKELTKQAKELIGKSDELLKQAHEYLEEVDTLKKKLENRFITAG